MIAFFKSIWRMIRGRGKSNVTPITAPAKATPEKLKNLTCLGNISDEDWHKRRLKIGFDLDNT